MTKRHKENVLMVELSALHVEMTACRQDLHRHSEFGFKEQSSAAFAAAKLREFGLDDVAGGVGGTGLVGTLKRGTAHRSIALRATMDALCIQEQGVTAEVRLDIDPD
jgi:metal-dependent amidase/aminoacylase/carboxypeptidase family protein